MPKNWDSMLVSGSFEENSPENFLSFISENRGYFGLKKIKRILFPRTPMTNYSYADHSLNCRISLGNLLWITSFRSPGLILCSIRIPKWWKGYLVLEGVRFWFWQSSTCYRSSSSIKHWGFLSFPPKWLLYLCAYSWKLDLENTYLYTWLLMLSMECRRFRAS